MLLYSIVFSLLQLLRGIWTDMSAWGIKFLKYDVDWLEGRTLYSCIDRLEKTFKILKSTINPELPRPSVNHVLKCHIYSSFSSSRDGDSATALGSLFQSSVTFSVKKCLLFTHSAWFWHWQEFQNWRFKALDTLCLSLFIDEKHSVKNLVLSDWEKKEE